MIVADVDGDGDLDALSAAYSDREIAWHENDGAQNFTTRLVSSAALGAESVIAVDLDLDGDLDAVSTSRIDDKIAWYENIGGGLFIRA